jgi:hypothetical protein
MHRPYRDPRPISDDLRGYGCSCLFLCGSAACALIMAPEYL